MNITDQTIQVKDVIKILAISKIEDEIEDRFIEWFIKDYEKAEDKDKTKVEDKDAKDKKKSKVEINVAVKQAHTIDNTLL